MRFWIVSLIVVASLFGPFESRGAGAKEESAEPSPHRLGFSIGVAYAQQREDLLVKTRWGGPAFEIDLVYEYSGTEHQHEVTLPLSLGYVVNRYSDEGIFVLTGLRYVYTYGWFRDLSWGTLKIGAVFDWDLQDDYYLSWDEEHLYWLTTYALGPVVEWELEFEPDHVVSAGVNLPMIALASRPPEHRFYKIGELNHVGYYFTKAHENMALTSWHEWFAMDLTADYLYRAGDHLHLGARYALEVKTHATPRRITQLDNLFLFRMVWALGMEETGE